LGASPWSIASKRRYVPPGSTREGRLARAAGFATHPLQALALHLGTGFYSPCIGRCARHLNSCIGAWTDDYAGQRLRCVGRPTRGAHSGVPVQPLGLGVDVRKANAAAATPGAGNRARCTAEVGDHLARAAAGHTLPRPVGCLCSISVAVALVAGHQAMRLAFCA